jgi:hypothetical protein
LESPVGQQQHLRHAGGDGKVPITLNAANLTGTAVFNRDASKLVKVAYWNIKNVHSAATTLITIPRATTIGVQHALHVQSVPTGRSPGKILRYNHSSDSPRRDAGDGAAVAGDEFNNPIGKDSDALGQAKRLAGICAPSIEGFGLKASGLRFK